MPLDHDAYLSASAFIEPWRSPALLTHQRPDGDALGAIIALYRLLRVAHKPARAYLFDPAGDRYRMIMEHGRLQPWNAQSTEEISQHCDGIIILDTCALVQLDPARDLLSRRPLPVLAVDHHVSREDIADHYLVDEKASATCLLLAEWATAAQWDIDRQTAEALFSGIATDSGWFRFSSVDSRTLRAAAGLVDRGVCPSDLYESFYMRGTAARLRILGRLLTDMELHADQRLAISCITSKMMQDSQATLDDCDELVNEMMRMGRVESAVLLTEHSGGAVKASLRSKRQVNVAQVAAQFGGGGHERAAGARMAGSMQTAKSKIVQALTEALRG